MQITDLHFGEKDSYDTKSVKVVEKVLDAEKPDLVVITGDLVSGYAWDRSPGFFQRHYSNAMRPIIERNVSYAYAFGNHDIEADLSGDDILSLDIQNPSSLTRRGPRELNGVTNYHLPIYIRDSDVIGSVVWIFDSGHVDCLGVSGWGCIHTDQVSWYKSQSSALSPNGDIPGYAFFHIPLYEHMDLWNSKEVRGDMSEAEGVCCSSVNTGLFAAMKERGDIKAAFVGHDHNNDYYGNYNGVVLGYGRKSGYGGYGPPIGWKRGARVIQINTNKEMTSWLRLEDGSKTVQSTTKSLFTSKLYGCCQMEGHGRNDGYLIATFVILTIIPTLVVLKMTHSCYRKWKASKRTFAQVELEPHDGAN